MGDEEKKRLAVWLSILFPGAGHFYLGDRRGGIALLCVTVSLLLAIVVSLVGPAPLRSRVTAVLLLFPYAMLSLPSARSLQTGLAAPPVSRSNLLIMLAVAGPMALPLLWQSDAFSRAAKFAWTVAVVGLVIVAVGAIIAAGPVIEELMRDVPV